MSIEYPEAKILATQLDETIKGKVIESYELKDYEKLQRVGFINRNLDDFKQLIGRRVVGAESSGNTIRVRLDSDVNILIAPEYGGTILYHRSLKEVNHHLQLIFSGGDSITIRLKSMGLIYVALDEQLDENYMYKRDYKRAPSPIDLTDDQLVEIISNKGTQLKPLLVGKDAVMTGLSNSAFQDILFRAGINPRIKASELRPEQVRALSSAIKNLVEERLSLGGKEEFVDLFGKPGVYTPTMGPQMKNRVCLHCARAPRMPEIAVRAIRNLKKLK